jgi:hypothetical protein
MVINYDASVIHCFFCEFAGRVFSSFFLLLLFTFPKEVLNCRYKSKCADSWSLERERARARERERDRERERERERERRKLSWR